MGGTYSECIFWHLGSGKLVQTWFRTGLPFEVRKELEDIDIRWPGIVSTCAKYTSSRQTAIWFWNGKFFQNICVNQLSTRRWSSSALSSLPGSAMQSVGEVMAIGRTFEVGLIRKSFLLLINLWQFPSKICINLTQQKTKKRLGLIRCFAIWFEPAKNYPKSCQVGERSSVAWEVETLDHFEYVWGRKNDEAWLLYGNESVLTHYQIQIWMSTVGKNTRVFKLYPIPCLMEP